MKTSLFPASPIEAAFARQNSRVSAQSVSGDGVYNEADGGDEASGGDGVCDKAAGGDGASGQPRKRNLQQVVTISDCVRVMELIISDTLVNAKKGVIVRGFAEFPPQFCGEFKVPAFF